MKKSHEQTTFYPLLHYEDIWFTFCWFSHIFLLFVLWGSIFKAIDIFFPFLTWKPCHQLIIIPLIRYIPFLRHLTGGWWLWHIWLMTKTKPPIFWPWHLALPCMFAEMLASPCSIIQLLTCYCHSWAIPILSFCRPLFTHSVWMHTYDLCSVAAPVHIPSVSYCCLMLPC